MEELRRQVTKQYPDLFDETGEILSNAYFSVFSLKLSLIKIKENIMKQVRWRCLAQDTQRVHTALEVVLSA